jgi:lysine-specific demethylase 8
MSFLCWQISELSKDIFEPDYCSASNGELHSVNAWFGPSGTVTPLHHDPHHNFLAQVSRKHFLSHKNQKVYLFPQF